MLELEEFDQLLLAHELTPMGPIPTVLDPDGVYPYPSFAETSRRPLLKRHHFVRLENDFLRVSVCPDLGGKVYSMVDKRSGLNALYTPDSIRPVRILPRWAFIPGGIEVSFPISHSPVQLERVHFEACQESDRLYVWCGERELHFGMEWTVEYSLGAGESFLTQRTFFRNRTPRAHQWMSWSNAAVLARPDTEFHFPNGPVLRHGAELGTIDWLSQGPRRVAELDRMAGFFWVEPDCSAFGVFTPSLGQGLYHTADPRSAPGMKLWSYGIGRHERWAEASSLSGEKYLEIQGGPLRDQSVREWLAPGETRTHTEFWVPSPTPLEIRKVKVPAPTLVPAEAVPWFDWPPREEVGYWRSVMKAHQQISLPNLPAAPNLAQSLWAPSGMELDASLAWASSLAEEWTFQWGTWLSAQERFDEALTVLKKSADDRARVVEARIYARIKRNPREAVRAVRQIQDERLALHPQVIIERDLLLASIGGETLGEREEWFNKTAGTSDEWVLERKAALLLDQGNAAQARALLESIPFQLVHQRYARTALWKRINRASAAAEAPVPDSLGEDDLAVFGAYRESAPGASDKGPHGEG